MIIEDNPNERYRYADWVSSIPAEKLGPLRVSIRQPDLSENEHQAIRMISSPETLKCPYHLALLDLKLDETDDEAKKGLVVLDEIRTRQAAHEIILVSRQLYTATNPGERITRIIQGGGVADYIDKLYISKERLQEAVLRSLQRTIARQSAAIFEQRIRDLVPYSEQGVAYVLSSCLSECLQEIRRSHGTLRSEVWERLRLAEQDRGDLIIQQLAIIDRAVTKAKSDWAERQQELGLSSRSIPQSIDIPKEIENLKNALEPALITKNATIVFDGPEPAHKALGFDTDVQAVLRELILGVLYTLPDFGVEEAVLRFSIAVREQGLDLQLHGRLPEPSRLHDPAVAGNTAGITEDRFSRRRGFSVMRHAALRGGGDLIVERTPEGTKMTYRIPIALHG